MTESRVVVIICISCVLILTSYVAARTKRSNHDDYPHSLYDEYTAEEVAPPQITSSTTTTIPPTTPPATTTTTKTTTERVLTETELESMAILNKTREKFDSAEVQLYKQQIKLTLKFLNSAIPRLRSIHKNMMELLNSSSASEAKPDGGGKSASNLSFSAYRERDDALDDEVTAVERSFASNRQLVARYSVALNNVRRHLAFFHSTLRNIILPELSRAQEAPRITTEAAENRSGVGSEDSGSIVDPTCGGIVEAEISSGSGFIQYRRQRPRSTNHPGQFQGQTGRSCLWIMTASHTGVRAGSAQKKMQVTLAEEDFLSSMTGSLSVGYFAGAAYDTPNSLKWTSFNQYSSRRIEIPAPVAYVHFVPTSNITTGQGAGFKLKFQVSDLSHDNSAPAQKRNFKNVFLSSRNGSIAYPSEGERVLPNERASIVLQPSSKNSRLFMKLLALDTEKKTKDFKNSINIYSFNRQLNLQRWSRIDELTGSWNVNKSQDFISSYDFYPNPNPSGNGNPLNLVHPILITYNYHESSSLSPSFELFWKTLSPTENSIPATKENVKRARIHLYTLPHHQGRTKYWELYNDKCVSVVSFLRLGEGVKSLTTKDTCVKVCDTVNCGGTCHIMKPGTLGHWNTEEINFQNRIRSIQAC